MIILLFVPGCGPAAPAVPRDPPGDPATAPSPNKTVDCAGAGDYTSLQDAIDGASDGDVVDVAPCTYTETIDFGGTAVRLQATSGPSDTILDGGGSGPVVLANSGEGRGTALAGFTITNGSSDDGAAVYVDLSKLRLEDVEITGNTGDTIVYDYTGDLELKDVTISGNTPASMALYELRGGLSAWNLSVDCDGAEVAVGTAHGTTLIDWSTFSCAAGTAYHNEHSTGRIQRTTLDGYVWLDNEIDADKLEDDTQLENCLLLGGAGVYVYGDSATFRNSVIEGTLELYSVSYATIEANIFTDSACAIDADSATSAFTPEYNLFDTGTDCGGWSGSDGNVSGDPAFVDRAGGDYRLSGASPAVDAGLPDAEYDDLDGTRNDIGAYGGPKTLAGGW